MRRPVWSLGDYQLVRKLYKGYSSSVYKAICTHTGLPVALKVYTLPELTDFLKHQVYRELEVHRRVQHRNIISLYAAFQEQKFLVLVLEYARGGSLQRVLKRAGGRLPERTMVDTVLHPLLQALRYLHSMGIVHRDLKPDNVLFTETWQLKLADFGVAIDLKEERAVTRTGTCLYMAPEVARCPLKTLPEDFKAEPTLAYTPAVDIWSLGVMAYESMVGATPPLAHLWLQVQAAARAQQRRGKLQPEQAAAAEAEADEDVFDSRVSAPIVQCRPCTGAMPIQRTPCATQAAAQMQMAISAPAGHGVLSQCVKAADSGKQADSAKPADSGKPARNAGGGDREGRMTAEMLTAICLSDQDITMDLVRAKEKERATTVALITAPAGAGAGVASGGSPLPAHGAGHGEHSFECPGAGAVHVRVSMRCGEGLGGSMEASAGDAAAVAAASAPAAAPSAALGQVVMPPSMQTPFRLGLPAAGHMLKPATPAGVEGLDMGVMLPSPSLHGPISAHASVAAAAAAPHACTQNAAAALSAISAPLPPADAPLPASCPATMQPPKLAFPASASALARDFVLRMLVPDPAGRPSAVQLLQHTLLWGGPNVSKPTTPVAPSADCGTSAAPAAAVPCDATGTVTTRVAAGSAAAGGSAAAVSPSAMAPAAALPAVNAAQLHVQAGAACPQHAF